MLERGDLVLIPYPFTDLSASKRRPVLVLTGIDAYGDFIGLPVTSRPGVEDAVPLSQQSMTRGVLPLPSWIRTDRIVTLNSSLAVKVVGQVAPQIIDTAAGKVCHRILPRPMPGQ